MSDFVRNLSGWDEMIWPSKKGHTVDLLVKVVDEGRGKLR